MKIKDSCPCCGGRGYIYYQVPRYETITRDMASDACDMELEGQQVSCGYDEVEEPCPECLQERKEVSK